MFNTTHIKTSNSKTILKQNIFSKYIYFLSEQKMMVSWRWVWWEICKVLTSDIYKNYLKIFLSPKTLSMFKLWILLLALTHLNCCWKHVPFAESQFQVLLKYWGFSKCWNIFHRVVWNLIEVIKLRGHCFKHGAWKKVEKNTKINNIWVEERGKEMIIVPVKNSWTYG